MTLVKLQNAKILTLMSSHTPIQFLFFGSTSICNFFFNFKKLVSAIYTVKVIIDVLNWCSLKQHNGELNGGAKASRAGRPWICACIICGFTDRSEGMCLILCSFTYLETENCCFFFLCSCRFFFRIFSVRCFFVW